VAEFTWPEEDAREDPSCFDRLKEFCWPARREAAYLKAPAELITFFKHALVAFDESKDLKATAIGAELYVESVKHLEELTSILWMPRVNEAGDDDGKRHIGWNDRSITNIILFVFYRLL